MAYFWYFFLVFSGFLYNAPFVNIALGQSLEEDIAKLKKDVAYFKTIIGMQQGEIRLAKSAAFAIGSVQQSFLTLAEFRKQMGESWVLCDGTNAPKTSKYTLLKLGIKVDPQNPLLFQIAQGVF